MYTRRTEEIASSDLDRYLNPHDARPPGRSPLESSALSRPVNVRPLSTAHRPRTHGLTDGRHHDLHARSSTGPRAPHVGARALHDALYAKRRARVETTGTRRSTLNWMRMQDLTDNSPNLC